MPLGGSSAIGAMGYVGAALEIADQARQTGFDFDLLVHATGSGGTQAGLIAGFAVLDMDVPIKGVSVKYAEQDMKTLVTSLAQDTHKLLSPDHPLPANAVDVTDDSIGAGYGLPTPDGIAALKTVARLEGILLDPVYTAKAMAWLFKEIKAGKLTSDQRVLFLHTGGSSGLFGYSSGLRPTDLAIS